MKTDLVLDRTSPVTSNPKNTPKHKTHLYPKQQLMKALPLLQSTSHASALRQPLTLPTPPKLHRSALGVCKLDQPANGDDAAALSATLNRDTQQPALKVRNHHTSTRLNTSM